MKIRNGLVTNSSSSSFIVVFKNELRTLEDVCMGLFGVSLENVWNYGNPFFDYTEKESETNIRSWGGKLACEAVFNQVTSKSRILTSYQIFKILEGGSPSISFFDTFVYDDTEEELERKIKSDKRLNKFISKEYFKRYPDGYFYKFTFSDNGEGSFGAALEHGNLFENVPHIQVSHH